MTVKTVVEDQVIEHEVINRETSLLAPGKTKLVQSGSDGKKTVTYEQRMVGREIRKKKVIDE
ncbi:G5 domain-containing protein, partial [Acinetobacter baumannii]|uniref:G5 domain-containing protein n=1 Tax=Acinetobacter baumannii TaxID=470 RepID=UPI0031F3AF80